MKQNQTDRLEFDPATSIVLKQSTAESLAKQLGITPERLLQAANATGAISGPVFHPGPVNVVVDGVRCFTPTELGRMVGLSPREFNKLLAAVGLQHKVGKHWCVTPAGAAFGVLLQVTKWQRQGTEVQQLKWKGTVLQYLGLAG